MKTKSVLILEDDAELRDILVAGLNIRGLETIAAGSPDEAWRLLGDVPDLDVALLDINLSGGTVRDQKGLEFGMKLRRTQRAWPPEFLIFSAYDAPDYYQTALALGAAAYLRKASMKGGREHAGHLDITEVLAQHVKALALRRALQGERPGMSARLELIAETSTSREEAIERFCADVLSEELKAIFDDHFILLLTHGGRTISFANEALGPLSPVALGRVQSAVHARLGEAEPLVLAGKVAWLTEEQRQATKRMEGAAFIELGEAEPFRLCLGLVPNGQGPAVVNHQIKLLDRYLQRPVIRHLLEITDLWSKLELERKLETQRHQVLLEATGDFCFYQGQELESELWEVEKKMGGPEKSAPLAKLRSIASELHDAGQLLTQFAEPELPTPAQQQPKVEMSELVDRVWKEEVAITLRMADWKVLKVTGEKCVAAERKERAARAVAQILGWMGRRILRLESDDSDVELSVDCRPRTDLDRVQIVFEERSSRRLPPHLRKTFFKPFYAGGSREATDAQTVPGKRLGLYLAHALAELAGGTLLDRSDDMPGPLGHRLVLELPAATATA